jgi:hypothetical protein
MAENGRNISKFAVENGKKRGEGGGFGAIIRLPDEWGRITANGHFKLGLIIFELKRIAKLHKMNAIFPANRGEITARLIMGDRNWVGRGRALMNEGG